MTPPKVNRFSGIFALAITAIAFSCQEEEERVTLADTAAVSEEAIVEAYYQDVDDISSVAISAPSDTEYKGGRKAATIQITVNDDRMKCAGVVLTLVTDPASTAQSPKGVLTVDFGVTGCSDLRGNIRTGKLVFAYEGQRFMPNSKVVITTDNYTINGVKLEGTRTVTNLQSTAASAPRFNAVLVGGRATFADGKTALRESTITWQWTRAANPNDDFVTIDKISTASGTTRNGTTYTVSLQSDLKYTRACKGIAVSGIKKYIVDGTKDILIDYGDGSCDQSVTITVNGFTRTIDVI